MTGRIDSGLRRRIIGLTGGMGSGKSSVAAFMRSRKRIAYIDADQVCRELLEPEQKGWLACRESFGVKYFNNDQTINRSRLRRDLFNDKQFRCQVNKLIHPLARETILSRTARHNDRDPGGVIVEIPLLFEAAWEKDFDNTVVVYTDPQKCLARIIKRDRVSRSKAETAFSAQTPLQEKAMRADHVIDNSGCWLDTCLQIMRLEEILWPAA